MLETFSLFSVARGECSCIASMADPKSSGNNPSASGLLFPKMIGRCLGSIFAHFYCAFFVFSQVLALGATALHHRHSSPLRATVPSLFLSHLLRHQHRLRARRAARTRNNLLDRTLLLHPLAMPRLRNLILDLRRTANLGTCLQRTP